jgi:phosphatidylinositol alpha-1,6-mannosyltransferase
MDVKEIEYWIAGTGEDRKRLEQRTREKGVADAVHFLGLVDDANLPEIYNQCDIFIMPSFVAERKPGAWTGEGFGIVYIEASACEKPVIGCDTGGQTDCIIDGVTGLLIKPDARAAAEAICRLVRHPKEAEAMGREGRRFVLEKFTLQNFRAKWSQLLKEQFS